jgi:hypothetical protein
MEEIARSYEFLAEQMAMQEQLEASNLIKSNSKVSHREPLEHLITRDGLRRDTAVQTNQKGDTRSRR